jgi:hypothetical protein
MSSTITFTTSFNAQWVTTTTNWLTTNTNYWIGDALRVNGVQPFYSLDFGGILNQPGINVDMGNI